MAKSTEVKERSKGTPGRGLQKSLTGVVVSDKAAKTVTVSITHQFRHPKYGKILTRSRKFLVHDEKDECGVGDTVEIIEGRPISRRKRWRVQQILEKAVQI